MIKTKELIATAEGIAALVMVKLVVVWHDNYSTRDGGDGFGDNNSSGNICNDCQKNCCFSN